MNENEKLAEKRADQAQPGEYAGETPEMMHDNVTGDRDTNGTSAGFVRFADTSGVKYAEDMDEVSIENHPDKGSFEE